MQKRLIDRLPEGALAEFDKTVDSVDHRRATRHREPITKRLYRYKFEDYQRWCSGRGYQTDALFITDARIEEYVLHLSSLARRAAPNTIKQAIAALKYYAERAAVTPMPSGRAACAVLKTYKAQLKAGGHI